MASDMFCWPNALIELPDAPAEAVEFVERLVCDPSFIRETRIRNVVEMCRRHDWRYRIRDLYEHFQMPLPEGLVKEIVVLDTLAGRLSLDLRNSGLSA
jgi:hypothetical protein